MGKQISDYNSSVTKKLIDGAAPFENNKKIISSEKRTHSTKDSTQKYQETEIKIKTTNDSMNSNQAASGRTPATRRIKNSSPSAALRAKQKSVYSRDKEYTVQGGLLQKTKRCRQTSEATSEKKIFGLLCPGHCSG